MNTAHSETQFNAPMYSLEFNIYGTGAEIRLNDIPVYYHDEPGTTESQKPIPESIIDGINTLTIRTFPLEENDNQYKKNAYVDATISVNEKNDPLNASKPVLQLRVNPANPENQLLNGSNEELGDKTTKVIEHTKKETIAERSIHIDSPYPRWAWQDGQTIENSQENYASLLEKYKEIYTALKSEDQTRIHQLYEPAAREFAAAYHYDDSSEGHRIMDTGGFINDSNWTLAGMNALLTKRGFHIRLFAYSTLADLIVNDYGISPIFYVENKSQNFALKKYLFYKNKNNEWVMIR